MAVSVVTLPASCTFNARVNQQQSISKALHYFFKISPWPKIRKVRSAPYSRSKRTVLWVSSSHRSLLHDSVKKFDRARRLESREQPADYWGKNLTQNNSSRAEGLIVTSLKIVRTTGSLRGVTSQRITSQGKQGQGCSIVGGGKVPISKLIIVYLYLLRTSER
jgi:hypothetical protein